MRERRGDEVRRRDELGASLCLDLRLELSIAPAGPGREGELEVVARLLAAGDDGDELAAGTRRTSRLEIDHAVANVGTILNRAMRWGDPDQGSRELLMQQGEALFDAVLPGAVKAALRLMDGGSLAIHGPAAVLGLPWEAAHTGRHFLGLAFAIGREPLETTSAAQTRPPSEWRTLVICDPRGDLIGSYYEGMALREELTQGARGADGEPNEAARVVDLRASEVGLADVKRLLREYDVVHFAGHAEPGGGAERGWWLGDGVLGPSAVRELIGGRSFPRLIFSNACRSASEGGLSHASGLAAAFLDAGVELYIGTTQDVPDEPASLFALTFYKALLAAPGGGVGEALRVSRVALAERYGEQSVYWASWVLYGDPRGECFGAQRRGAVAVSRPVATRPIGLPALAAQIRGAVARSPVVVGLDGVGWQDRLDPRRWSRRARLSVVLGIVMAVLGAMVVARSASSGVEPGSAKIGSADVEVGAVGDPEGLGSGRGRRPNDLTPTSGPGSRGPADVERTVLAGADASGHVDAAPGPTTAPAPGAELDPVVPSIEVGWGQTPAPSPTASPSQAAQRLALEVVRAPGAERETGGRVVLRSRESFRLEIEVGERGWIALWQVESQGNVRRIYPQQEMLAEIGAPGTLILPEGNRWFWLDNNVGTERFILAWREVAPSDPAGFADELEQETRAIGNALVEARRTTRGPRLELRGLGGTRAGESAAALLGRLREALDDRFERVEELVVEHR